MKKEIRRFATLMIAGVFCAGILAGCGKEEEVFESESFAEYETFYDDETFAETGFEDGEFFEDETFFEESFGSEEFAEESFPDGGGENTGFAAGKWYTEGYDETDNWAMSYCLELKEDGTATCVGYRNKDAGTYVETGADSVLITFDKCEVDETGVGFKPVDGFTYTVEMTVNGDDATIKIDAPDVISNLEDGKVSRKAGEGAGSAAAAEGDEGEGVQIADGEYVTDSEYTGELSADGKTMTITTALYEFVNSPSPSYEKRTYVLNVSDSCKCTQITEDEKVTSFFESMDLINDFLEGKSGLPITLTIKDNELVGIMFSS